MHPRLLITLYFSSFICIMDCKAPLKMPDASKVGRLEKYSDYIPGLEIGEIFLITLRAIDKTHHLIL
jgi:hypothetical protein